MVGRKEKQKEECRIDRYVEENNNSVMKLGKNK